MSGDGPEKRNQMEAGATVTSQRAAPWVRWVYEFLFALSLGWLTIWYERMRSPASLSWLYSSPLVQYPYWHTRHVEPETVLVQDVWSLVLSLVIFLILRLLARFSVTGTLLRTVGGAFVIIGFAFFALRFPVYFFDPSRISFGGFWFPLEAMVALIVGILYYLRKWPLPAWIGLLLLFLHFGLWAWVTGCWVSPPQEIRAYGLGSLGIWISAAFYWGFPVIGFFSSLIWGLYVRLPTSNVATIPTHD